MYYQIQTPKAKYNLVDNNGDIYIGGDTFTCTEVVGSILYFDKDLTDCYLVKFDDWNAKDMMYALFYYYKIKNRKFCRIQLTDTSSNNSIGNLSSYYIAFYNKTMYELNFHAYLEDQNLRDTYEDNKKIFYTKQVTNEKFLQFLKSKNVSEENINVLMDLYTNANTYREFFDNLKNVIKNKLNEKKDKVTEQLIKPWLDEFVKINLRFNIINQAKWIIECKDNDFDDTGFSIFEVSKEESLPKWRKDFITIRRKAYYLRQLGSGSRVLSERERECFKNPNWIGWKKYSLDEYNDIDREYLESLLKNF